MKAGKLKYYLGNIVTSYLVFSAIMFHLVCITSYLLYNVNPNVSSLIVHSILSGITGSLGYSITLYIKEEKYN